MNTLVMPLINKKGKNTTSVVRVEPHKAPITSLVPSLAAFISDFPSSSLPTILSRTTIELSTRSPTASARPVIETKFKVSPIKYMAANVAVIEIGILSATTEELRHPPKKRIRISTTRTRANIADCARLFIERSMSVPSLLRTLIVTPGGKRFRISGRAASTPLVTSRVFASDCFWISTVTLFLPLTSSIVVTSTKLSFTWAMSPTRTGMVPSRTAMIVSLI